MAFNSTSAKPAKLFVAGLSYKTAPVEVREKLAIAANALRCHGCRMKLAGGLNELVLVSTCNRVELYGTAGTVNGNIHRAFDQLSSADLDLTPYLYVKEGNDAVKHLFSVSSGLDSMVIGETEITGQVKNAYLSSKEAGLTGGMTNRLFQTALQTAKEIRTTTGIGRGATSVGSVAVELAERIFDHDLSQKTILIIGAGKMGEACVRHLAKKGAKSVLVVNRSLERAANLAAEFNGEALPFEQLLPAMVRADIVVSSTGAPQTILHRAELSQVMAARKGKALFLIDIAVPRDIAADVESIDGVYLYNVDHLEEIVRENVRHREQELARCQAIIQEKAASLMQRFTAPAFRPQRSMEQAVPTLSTHGIPELA